MKNIDEMTTRELVEALLNDTEIQDVMEERIICEDIAGQTHKERDRYEAALKLLEEELEKEKPRKRSKIDDMTEEETMEALRTDPEVQAEMREALIRGMFEPEDKEQTARDREVLKAMKEHEEKVEKLKARNGLRLVKA